MMKKLLLVLCLFASGQISANDCVREYNKILDKADDARVLYQQAEEYYHEGFYRKASESANRSAGLNWELVLDFERRQSYEYCYDQSSLTESKLQRDIRNAKNNERLAKCLRDRAIARVYMVDVEEGLDTGAVEQRNEMLDDAIGAYQVAKRHCSGDQINRQIALLKSLKVKIQPPSDLVKGPNSEAVEYGLFKVDKAFVKDSPFADSVFETVDGDCHIRFVSRDEDRRSFLEIDLAGEGDVLDFGEINEGDQRLQLSLSPARVNLENYNLYIKYDNGKVIRLGGAEGRSWGLPVGSPVRLKKALSDLSAACKI